VNPAPHDRHAARDGRKVDGCRRLVVCHD
jgi:hypothetical protein